MLDILGGVGDTGGLTCIYFAMLMVGVIYALVILIGSGMGEGVGHIGGDIGGDIGGHDFDLSGGDFGGGDSMHGSVELTHVSPVTIAGFVTAFGAFGLISQGLFDASTGASLVLATIGGILVGLVSHVAFIYFFIKPQGSSEVTRRDVIGARAEVITPIPAGNVGAIAFVAQGARVTVTARSADGSEIPRGTTVLIRDKVGSVAVVTPLGFADTEGAPDGRAESQDGPADGRAESQDGPADGRADTQDGPPDG